MLSEEVRQRLDEMIASDRVVLFMKGTPEAPQCGFSATTIGILDALVPTYTTFNVLEDPSVREGIKAYSSWPTVPQLYVDREFVGGCDIVKQMYNAGDLHETLGAEPPDRTPPEITLSDEASSLMANVLDGQPGNAVHLRIDSHWQHHFNLGPAEGHEIKAQADGVEILMDIGTAPRANGMRVEVEETLQGHAFRVDNPNAPPPVQQLSPIELKQRLEAGSALHLFDVRSPPERERCRIDPSRLLDEAAMAEIAALPRDAALVFYCHMGGRSQSAAEHFRLQGFANVANLEGGINAWSDQVDPAVAKY